MLSQLIFVLYAVDVDICCSFSLLLIFFSLLLSALTFCSCLLSLAVAIFGIYIIIYIICIHNDNNIITESKINAKWITAWIFFSRYLSTFLQFRTSAEKSYSVKEHPQLWPNNAIILLYSICEQMFFMWFSCLVWIAYIYIYSINIHEDFNEA